MTTRPRLKLGTHMLWGLLAVALFAVLAVVFLDAGFGDGTGFEAGVSITAGIGYAMFNLSGAEVPSEGFLVAFEIIDFVLVAALVGAVMLARREGGSVLEAVRRDGGRGTDASGPPADGTDDDARTDGGER